MEVWLRKCLYLIEGGSIVMKIHIFTEISVKLLKPKKLMEHTYLVIE